MEVLSLKFETRAGPMCALQHGSNVLREAKCRLLFNNGHVYDFLFLNGFINFIYKVLVAVDNYSIMSL